MKNKIYILFLFLFIPSVFTFGQLRLEGIKREALKHMQNGHYGDAIDQLNKFIAAEPRNPEGYYLRGLCYEKRQQYAYGREDYRKAIKLNRKYTEARKALERLKRIWYEILYDKIEGHKRDIAVNPDNAFYYLEIGKAYRWLEEWEKAEEWYDKYLALDKNASPDEIIRYTLILTETRHIYKGWVILKKYTERYPEDWRIWSRFGWFSNWLSKYKIAEVAFLKALDFKPFFKEALDGLDVARREAYVTLYSEDYNGNDRRNKVYPIDKYYRIIKNDPFDDESRFRLVELLMEHDRYEEAFQQLKILEEKHGDEERFKNLLETTVIYRTENLNEKIGEALNELNSDPFDRKAIIDLGRYYRGLRAYAEGETVLSNYLSRFPKDEEARYLLAKIYSEDLKLDNALNECDTLLILSPENLDYKLLTAQLNIWAKRDLSLAEKLLDDVLSAREDDIYALIAAGLLNLLHNKPEKAEEYTSRAKAVDPINPDLKDLIKLVESESIRKEEDSYMETLNKGREIAKEGDCKTALSYFEQYMDRYPDNYKIQEEYASILVCADYFSEAIDIYDKLLDEQYDLELDKTRAKIYYWSGDSLKAYDELQRLVLEDPQDMEMQLYFGDVNAKMKNYEAAKKIYLALKKRAPKSYLINQRLEWLPAEFHETTTLGRIFGGITNYVFSFMNLNPLTSYYNDNLGFEYYYYGAQLGIGFTKYVSLGGSFYSGNLNNTSTSSNRLSFTTTKLNVFINPMKELSIGLGYGRLNSKGILNTPVYDAQITYTPLANLQTSLRFEHTDGAFQLFSNDLINKRILSNNIKFDGNYTMNGGLYLESYYSLLWTENSIYEGKNVGNYFQVRIGKLFTNNMKFGYEYHFEDYKYNSPLYYTPQVFVSHSIWGDWEVFQTDLWRFKIGGKLGYVPESDFILREVKTEVSYKIIDSLKLLATGFLSSSIQDVTAYSSGAFYLNLFWSIY